MNLPYRNCNCRPCVKARGRRAPKGCEFCGERPQSLLFSPHCGPICREMAAELESMRRTA